MQELEADLICFEYDYPDIPRLNLLQKMRHAHPDSPILMFTEQHSEALAVWAFRTGVWDYHVTPMSEVMITEVINALENAASFRFAVREQNPRLSLVRLPDEVRFRASEEDVNVLQPAINHIELHYSSKISEEKLAELCQLTPTKFSRLFKQRYEITFQEYMVRYRLKESARLLLNPVATISDIAYSVGFNDPSYYARAFKKYLGVSPSRFRRLLEDNQKVDCLTADLLQAG